MSIKRQSFLKGAAILFMAHLVVKVVGAGFKIPLNHILGNEGMGIFGKTYMQYTGLFVIATAGLPVAVSKMVAASVARKRYAESERIFKVALSILSVIGLFGSLIFYFGADNLAAYADEPLAASSMRAIAPAIFFVSFMSAVRGYFQGNQNMIPTAFSECVEALVKLTAGILLALLLIPHGMVQGVDGAIFGVTIGSIGGSVYLALAYLMKKPSQTKSADPNMMSYASIAKSLISIAIPITVGASILTLTSLIDTYTITDSLHRVGFTVQQARALFGIYTGQVVTMFNMPLTLLTAVSMSIIPAISSTFALKDLDGARKNCVTALSVTLMFAIPSAFGLAALSSPILSLLFPGDEGAVMLSVLAFAIIFVSMVSVTTAILQAVGRVYIPVVNMFVGGVVKLIVNYTLVGTPHINITGAAIGSVVCYAIIAALNMFFVIMIVKPKLPVANMLIKPLFAGAMCGLAAKYCYGLCSTIVKSNSLNTLTAICAGGIVYLLFILSTGALTEEMLDNLPQRAKIARFFKK